MKDLDANLIIANAPDPVFPGRSIPESAHRGPEIIERNTRVLTQLIEELLDVSRIITGKLRLDVRSVNLVCRWGLLDYR